MKELSKIPIHDGLKTVNLFIKSNVNIILPFPVLGENRCFHTPHLSRRRTGSEVKCKIAFTLGEVLITLAIIGVIAAVTLPTLVKNYQHKVLEVKFNKSTAIIKQIVTKAKYDLGTENFSEYCGRTNNNSIIVMCYKALSSNVQLLSIPKNSPYNYQILRKSNDIKTYNGNPSYIGGNNILHLYQWALKDGSFMRWYATGGALQFYVDTNGYAKPNQLGHDIFQFTLTRKDDTLTGYAYNKKPNTKTDEEAETAYDINNFKNYDEYYYNQYGDPCNLTSKRGANGISCSYYALRNECPWDSSRTYWECLP